ncbi:hypothetical protein BD560DRAFT_427184 [Blakeslea trispora]|nr:hypothetical protein BD560DRAFT_427184 [Blakeslea trispora]
MSSRGEQQCDDLDEIESIASFNFDSSPMDIDKIENEKNLVEEENDEFVVNEKFFEDLLNFRKTIQTPVKILQANDKSRFEKLPIHSQKSIEFNRLLKSFNTTKAAKEEIIKWVNSFIADHTESDIQLLSPYRCDKLEKEQLTPVSLKEYKMCKNGCKMYFDTDDSTICTNPKCLLPRTVDNLAPVKQLPLAVQLGHFLESKQNRDKISYAQNNNCSIYRRQQNPTINKIQDFFDGEFFKQRKDFTKDVHQLWRLGNMQE